MIRLLSLVFFLSLIPLGNGLQADPLRTLQPILVKHCVMCHNEEEEKGGLNLDAVMAVRPLARSAEVWKDVVEQIQFEEMPPRKSIKKTGYTEQDRKKLVSGLTKALKQVNYADYARPGRVTISRLNNQEYDNTIRDLFGLNLTIRPSRRFPSSRGGNDGYSNNSDAMFMSASAMERYLEASNLLMNQIVPRKSGGMVYQSSQFQLSKGSHKGGVLTLSPGSYAVINHHASKSGMFLATVTAGRKGGSRMGVQIGMSINTKLQRKVMVKSASPQKYQFYLKLKQGSNRIAVKHLGKGNKAGQVQLKLLSLTARKKGGGGLINKPMMDARNRLFTTRPQGGSDATRAARKVLTDFMTRAYRRPVKEEDLKPYLGLFNRARDRGDDFDQAIAFALKGVLVSPGFLFRAELHQKRKGKYMLDHYDMASRLSYFLWSSMPDQRLFDLAAKKKLQDPKVIAAEVKRMLKDPKASAMTTSFASEWLGINELGITRMPDRKKFPEFNILLRNAMQKEVTTFFDAVIRENRSVLEVIDADYTYVNGMLAEHYGIKGVTGTGFQKVKLKNRERGGVLGMGAIHTITSFPLRTSPVLRGVYVLNNILGTPPPPAPMDIDIPELPADDSPGNRMSLRKMLEKHRDVETCANCHAQIDPLGFGLENFDPIGRYRRDIHGRSVDARGKLPTGETFKGPAAMKKIILRTRLDDFINNLTRQMLSYALGRRLHYYDQHAIDQIIKKLKASGYQSETLITEIVLSVPFRHADNE